MRWAEPQPICYRAKLSGPTQADSEEVSALRFTHPTPDRAYRPLPALPFRATGGLDTCPDALETCSLRPYQINKGRAGTVCSPLRGAALAPLSRRHPPAELAPPPGQDRGRRLLAASTHWRPSTVDRSVVTKLAKVTLNNF
jgi:hypothetical protein